MKLTREQLEMKVMMLEMALGVIARNELSCPDIHTARTMAANALEMVDAKVTAPPPRDIFEALGLGDNDTIIDARTAGAPDISVADIRKEVAEG